MHAERNADADGHLGAAHAHAVPTRPATRQLRLLHAAAHGRRRPSRSGRRPRLHAAPRPDEQTLVPPSAVVPPCYQSTACDTAPATDRQHHPGHHQQPRW